MAPDANSFVSSVESTVCRTHGRVGASVTVRLSAAIAAVIAAGVIGLDARGLPGGSSARTEYAASVADRPVVVAQNAPKAPSPPLQYKAQQKPRQYVPDPTLRRYVPDPTLQHYVPSPTLRHYVPGPTVEFKRPARS